MHQFGTRYRESPPLVTGTDYRRNLIRSSESGTLLGYPIQS